MGYDIDFMLEADKQVGEIHRFKSETIVRQAPVKLFHQLNVVARQFALIINKANIRKLSSRADRDVVHVFLIA